MDLGRAHVAVAADADALAVVGRDHHGRVVEVAALLAPGEEGFDLLVGDLDLAQVLRVVAAAGVAGLVDAEQLEHEQVGVFFGHDLLRARDEGVVDVVVVHHGGDGAHVSSPKASIRWAMPTSLPSRPSRRSASKTVSHFTPRLGTKLLRMPCTAGDAPVSIELKQVTVRAG